MQGSMQDDRSASDAALLERMRRRDVTALEELYDVYARVALGVAYKTLGELPAAEEAVQEAFLGVWNGVVRFDASRGSVRT